MGGLQAALALSSSNHKITLPESAFAFEDVGAGIRVPPNSIRPSESWGVDFSKKRNVTIRMGARVSSYDFETPSVTLASGEVIALPFAMLFFNGSPIAPQDTGDVAYRILVPTALLLADPEMRHLVSEPWAMHWMGPEGHAVGYPLRKGELYNIIVDVTHGSDKGEPVGEDAWKSARNNGELVARFQVWCPQVRKLCAMTGEYLQWRLADFSELDSWVHTSGKVCLLGDACHPMMPYMARGAAQATEDAAALKAALDVERSITAALARYRRARLPRAAYVARNTTVLQEWLHLYGGPSRRERDRLMQRDDANNPIFWGCRERKDWLFGHNALNLNGNERIPALPPLPTKEASVYRKGGHIDRRNAAGRI
ncbi:hypothetical protein CERZMDRAFT_114586 [Cercospora zeae-maydis SCOH1-5]|uniref:FAD-binding domain-containing protein n=1 Tax=Cercospora zeae-maydis SCOH1-5 TaxID=717836 RepID=A0A6A6F4H2_9PEZI|nr:hypothetical protein CERZMDRAFT_114586 [Cercospora zeae-maydis SCOH1-5]